MTTERPLFDRASRGIGETGIDARGLDREGILKGKPVPAEKGISPDPLPLLTTCPCPDPTKPTGLKITLPTQTAKREEKPSTADSHPDLKYLEQVEARQAQLAFRAWEDVYENPLATRKVEKLEFSFSREKATKKGDSKEALDISRVGHQDIRIVQFEWVRALSPDPGGEVSEWSQLSLEVEKTGIEPAAARVACGKETQAFANLKGRALSTVEFFEQILVGIDPALLPLSQEKIKDIRGRISNWGPHGGECKVLVQRRGDRIREPDILVPADLLKEKVITPGKAATPTRAERAQQPQPKELFLSFKPILFKHDQPATSGQPSTPLTDESALEDAATQLKKEILPWIENKVLLNLKFMVYGYADTTGNGDGKNPEYNRRLSERRAEWVINQLAKRCGEKIGGVLTSKGCGDACAPPGGKPSPPHRAVIIKAVQEAPGK